MQQNMNSQPQNGSTELSRNEMKCDDQQKMPEFSLISKLKTRTESRRVCVQYVGIVVHVSGLKEDFLLKIEITLR